MTNTLVKISYEFSFAQTSIYILPSYFISPSLRGEKRCRRPLSSRSPCKYPEIPRNKSPLFPPIVFRSVAACNFRIQSGFGGETRGDARAAGVIAPSWQRCQFSWWRVSWKTHGNETHYLFFLLLFARRFPSSRAIGTSALEFHFIYVDFNAGVWQFRT